ncbi:hypothetical protein TWF191_008930 [Orbilia oligospora]|uniref:NACHT domain-containing protein n=1 Tax=Orbilia oligospora TaxID=2813651 RepID=A0A7C8USY7_ORBOL|nr:hypothetical protein TWF191_008930 [Orbilia oligospora]
MVKRRGKNDYHIGWICALSVELKAAIEMLDEEHPEILCNIFDNNKYRFGQIGHCNIVIVCLPAGVYGTNAAAAVAANFRRSFPGITAYLMVGIGGGAPLLPHNDVRLGDVVVGLPGNGHGGILQYDFGKTVQAGKFISIGTMNMPPPILLGVVSDLQADHLTRANALDEAIEKALASLSADVAAKFSCPSAETDRLFQAKYDHPAENESCDQCNNDQVVVRQPRLENRFNIHYGLIASGNQVMKYAPNSSTFDEAVNSESYECLRYLDATDPRNDKARYEATKDELIEKSYSWILSDPSFKAWTLNNENPVLWVSGGAGKGKTMLTMGIVESFEHRSSESHQRPVNSVTYFFCQATDNRRNSAAAVLKGILYHLILSDKDNILVRYLKEEYDKGGPDCLSGPNAFYVIQRVFFKIFHDQIFEELYFLVDALDECTDGLTELLNFVSRSLMLPGSSKIKWFLTSRNRPDIEERLDSKGFLRRISLEENNTQITAAVNDYINEKITHLSKSKRYSAEVFNQIQKILQERAGNTFLWVHLACKELARIKASQVIQTLQKIPSGLQEFYQEMLNNIERTNTEEDTGLCRQLLSAVTLAVRPLSLSEMAIVAGLPPEMNEYEMEVQVKQCGSFLIVQEKTVLFVHQSAKDFLDGNSSGKLDFFGPPTRSPHYLIVKRSVGGRENIDKDWGPLIQTFRTFQPVNYDHVSTLECYGIKSIAISADGKYLASSPASSNSNGITIWDFTSGIILKELESHYGAVRALTFSASTAELASASDDTSIRIWNILSGENQLLAQGRDIISLAWLVQNNELGTTRRKFYNLDETFRDRASQGSHSISQSDFGEILCYLCKDELIAYGSENGSILIWNMNTRRLSSSFRQFDTPVTCLRGSPDGSQLASGSVGGVIRLLDVHSGTLIRTFELENATSPIHSIDFSPDGKQLVSASSIRLKNKIFQKSTHVPVVTLLEIASGKILRKQKIPPQDSDGDYLLEMSFRVIFSPDGLHVHFGVCRRAKRLVKIYIWNLASKKKPVCLFELPSVYYSFMSVPHQLQFVAAQGFDIMRYEIALSGSTTVGRALTPGSMVMHALAISPDGKMLASIQTSPQAHISKSGGYTIRLINLDSNEMVWTSKFRLPRPLYDREVIPLKFSPDGRLLLVPVRYQTLPISLPVIWATASGKSLSYPPIVYNKNVTSITFSSDSKVAMAFCRPIYSTIMIWDTEDAMIAILSTGHEGFPGLPINKLTRGQEFPQPTRELNDHGDKIVELQFSAGGTKLMSISRYGTAQLWDVSTGTLLYIVVDHRASCKLYHGITENVYLLSDIFLDAIEIPECSLLDTISGKSKPLPNFRAPFIKRPIGLERPTNRHLPPIQNGQFVDFFCRSYPFALYILDPQTITYSGVIEASWLKDREVNLLYLPRKYQPELIGISNIYDRTTCTIALGTKEGFYLVLRLPSPSTQSTNLYNKALNR